MPDCSRISVNTSQPSNPPEIMIVGSLSVLNVPSADTGGTRTHWIALTADWCTGKLHTGSSPVAEISYRLAEEIFYDLPVDDSSSERRASLTS